MVFFRDRKGTVGLASIERVKTPWRKSAPGREISHVGDRSMDGAQGRTVFGVEQDTVQEALGVGVHGSRKEIVDL